MIITMIENYITTMLVYSQFGPCIFPASILQLLFAVSSYRSRYRGITLTLVELNKVNQSAPVAYFSMEVGLESAMPTYNGGLGVLAGDILRSAADMDVNMMGITLLNR